MQPWFSIIGTVRWRVPSDALQSLLHPRDCFSSIFFASFDASLLKVYSSQFLVSSTVAPNWSVVSWSVLLPQQVKNVFLLWVSPHLYSFIQYILKLNFFPAPGLSTLEMKRKGQPRTEDERLWRAGNIIHHHFEGFFVFVSSEEHHSFLWRVSKSKQMKATTDVGFSLTLSKEGQHLSEFQTIIRLLNDSSVL